MGAAERLNEDFRLGLPIRHKPTPAEAQAARRRREVAEAHRAFEEWRSEFIQKLGSAFRAGHLVNVRDLDKLTDREATALRMRDAFEYWADELANGPPEVQAQLYREREGIARWIDRALNNC